MQQQAVINWKKLEYRGKKQATGGCTIYVKAMGVSAETWSEPLRHVARHSPDGFQWGYGGSGPADCALSILTDFCHRTKQDVSIAETLYMRFKFEVIAGIQGDLHITSESIDTWIKANS